MIRHKLLSWLSALFRRRKTPASEVSEEAKIAGFQRYRTPPH